MRPILFAVLISVIVMELTARLSLAQFVPETGYLSISAPEIISDHVPTSYQSDAGQRLIVAQKTVKDKKENKATKSKEEKKADKDKEKKTDKDKEEEKVSDRVSNYKCIEYCAVVRQSCEGLASIQPVEKISNIGSMENNEWSGKCQKIYTGCIDKCNFNDKKVNWKRVESKKIEKINN